MIKKGLKVLYFSRAYTTHDHRFLSFMINEGFEVYFLTLERDSSPKEDRFLPENVKLLPRPNNKIGKINPIRFAMHLRKIIRDIQPDIIHTGPIQTCAYITSLTNFHPYVAMSWGSDLLIDANENWVSTYKTKKSIRKADAFIGDCQAVLDTAKEFGIEESKTSIFPWGIDLDKFSPKQSRSLKTKFGWEENFIFVHSRSWEPIYNVLNFVKGFISAYEKNKNIRLFMLGNGSLSKNIKSLIYQANLQEVVYFAGQVSQEKLTEYYNSADVYVSASLSDGSSVSLMEALANGTPALVSDIPGNREWVTPNQQGWLFNPTDIQEITNGILNAASQKDLVSYQFAARDIATQKADWKINAQGINKAYQIAITGVT
jgi:L-malate glycosyltransferase